MGDMFDQSERAVRSARLGVAMGVGQMLGQALAGAIGPGMGWRAPFVVVVLPAHAIERVPEKILLYYMAP